MMFKQIYLVVYKPNTLKQNNVWWVSGKACYIIIVLNNKSDYKLVFITNIPKLTTCSRIGVY